MNINEFISVLVELKEKYGDNIEVYKIKHNDYLSPIFKNLITYNKQNNIIEI